MNHDSSGDFHAVNREQIILQLYRYVNPVDSHTETRVSVNSDHILEINVVDPDVVSIAWIIDGQIISNSSKLDLGSLDLTEDKLIYGLAWDNSLNLDYRTNDRGGWIREDEDSRTFRNISWMYKVDKSMQAHDQGGNINYLNLAMTSSTVKNFFNHTEVISNISLIDAETNSSKPSTHLEPETKVVALGWKDDWLGVHLPFDNSWSFHLNYKWIYIVYGETLEVEGIWVWFRLHGWMWTKPSLCPYFYSNETKEWFYLN